MNCRVIAVFLLALVVPAAPGEFSKRGLQNDRALAKARDRLHIVYATAAWCGPCQRMKQETWVNPLVEAWIGEHAVMTAVDIDEYPKFREQKEIRGIPALILMDGTTEVARFSGYKTAAETLSWLERNRRRAESGSGNASQAARTGAERTATPQRARTNLSPMQRWEQADALMKAGRTETATRMLIDLWTTPLDERDSAMENVRVVFTRFSIEKLVGQHELAHRAFSKVRDHTLRRLHAGEQDARLVADWVLLNGMLGDERLTMGWAETVLEQPQALEILGGLVVEVSQQAIAAERWDIVVGCLPDPVAELERRLRITASTLHLQTRNGGAHPFDSPEGLAMQLTAPMVAALHAGDGGATERRMVAVLEEVMADHDAWRMVFLDAARRSGTLREDHTAWIEAHDLEARFAGSTVFASFAE